MSFNPSLASLPLRKTPLFEIGPGFPDGGSPVPKFLRISTVKTAPLQGYSFHLNLKGVPIHAKRIRGV